MTLDDELDNILFDLQNLYHKISDECPNKGNVLTVIDMINDIESIWGDDE